MNNGAYNPYQHAKPIRPVAELVKLDEATRTTQTTMGIPFSHSSSYG